MSQPVKLSDSLVLDARLTGRVAERSLARQIEFWARLGRAVEPLLSSEKAMGLRRSGDAQPLSTLIASVDAAEGRQRVAEYLASQPFPHYEPASDEVASGLAGLLVRTEEDGQQTVGRFVRGEFQPVKSRARRASSNVSKGTNAKTRPRS